MIMIALQIRERAHGGHPEPPAQGTHEWVHPSRTSFHEAEAVHPGPLCPGCLLGGCSCASPVLLLHMDLQG